MFQVLLDAWIIKRAIEHSVTVLNLRSLRLDFVLEAVSDSDD